MEIKHNYGSLKTENTDHRNFLPEFVEYVEDTFPSSPPPPLLFFLSFHYFISLFHMKEETGL
jgi:hypothetical protein